MCSLHSRLVVYDILNLFMIGSVLKINLGIVVKVELIVSCFSKTTSIIL